VSEGREGRVGDEEGIWGRLGTASLAWRCGRKGTKSGKERGGGRESGQARQATWEGASRPLVYRWNLLARPVAASDLGGFMAGAGGARKTGREEMK
jgi:hypothetical protein